MIRTNTFKMADGCGEEPIALKNLNWGYYEAKCPVEISTDEEIQRQSYSIAMQNQTSQPETKVQESKTPKQHFGTEPEYMSIF